MTATAPDRARLFVAVWPSPAVQEALARLDRPPLEGVRWTTPGQWHVTLRFFGPVPIGEVDRVVAAVAGAVAGEPPVEAVLGPSVSRLGRGVIVVPVAGLDAVASSVVGATTAFGQPPGERRFRGHVTLARTKGRVAGMGALLGAPLSAAWEVREVAVVRSRLDRAGARYEVIGRAPLGGSATR